MVFHSVTHLMHPRSPAINLQKLILQLFSGHTRQFEYHLSSHSELIDILCSGEFNAGFFGSYDAVKLHPSIIIIDALQSQEKMVNNMKWAW